MTEKEKEELAFRIAREIMDCMELEEFEKMRSLIEHDIGKENLGI